MSLKPVLSLPAREQLEHLLDHLKETWSVQVQQEFIQRLDQAVAQACRFPKSGPKSEKFKGVRKMLVSRQTSFYYRVSSRELQILAIFDARQDPQSLRMSDK